MFGGVEHPILFYTPYFSPQTHFKTKIMSEKSVSLEQNMKRFNLMEGGSYFIMYRVENKNIAFKLVSPCY